MGRNLKLVNFTDKEWITFPCGKASEIKINDLPAKMIAAYICGNTYHGMEKHVRMADWEDIIAAKEKDSAWRDATADLLYDMFQDQFEFHSSDIIFLFNVFGNAGRLDDLLEILKRIAEK